MDGKQRAAHSKVPGALLCRPTAQQLAARGTDGRCLGGSGGRAGCCSRQHHRLLCLLLLRLLGCLLSCLLRGRHLAGLRGSGCSRLLSSSCGGGSLWHGSRHWLLGGGLTGGHWLLCCLLRLGGAGQGSSSSSGHRLLLSGGLGRNSSSCRRRLRLCRLLGAGLGQRRWGCHCRLPLNRLRRGQASGGWHSLRRSGACGWGGGSRRRIGGAAGAGASTRLQCGVRLGCQLIKAEGALALPAAVGAHGVVLRVERRAVLAVGGEAAGGPVHGHALQRKGGAGRG